MRLTRIVPTVGVVLAAALTIPAASASAQAPTCPDVDVTASASNEPASVAALTCLLNVERTQRGLPVLVANPQLTDASQQQADDMVARNYKDIKAPDGTTVQDRARAVGYPAGQLIYGAWLAEGLTPYTNAQKFITMVGGCSVLTDVAATEIGVAVAAASDGPRFVVTLSGPSVTSTPNPSCPFSSLKVAASPLASAQLLSLQTTGKVAKALGLPSSNSCQSRRAFQVRVKEPGNIRLSSATLSLPGRKTSKAVRRGGRLRGLVDLRGYPRGKFKLTIKATTTTGVKLTGTRTYKTCQKSTL